MFIYKTDPCTSLIILSVYWRVFNRIRFSFSTDFGFNLFIAIMIAIENRSGKTGDRFSFRNRSAISGSKSIPEIFFQIDPRLKTRFRIKITGGAPNRGSIFLKKSDPDFHFKIDCRFYFFDREPIFGLKSRSRSRSKYVPEKTISDFYLSTGSQSKPEISDVLNPDQSRFLRHCTLHRNAA